MTSWIEDPGTDNWRGLRLSELGVDEAFLNVTSAVKEKLWLYILSEDCENCPFQKHSTADTGETILKISTKRNLKFRVLNDGGSDLVAVSNISARVCNDVTAELGEFGVYDFLLEPNNDGQVTCDLVTAKECVNIYLPLASVVIGLVTVALISTFITYGTKKIILYWKEKQTSNKVCCEMSDYGADDRTTQISAKPAKHRIRSVDTFRGGFLANWEVISILNALADVSVALNRVHLTMPTRFTFGGRIRNEFFLTLSVVVMIFVNDGAGHYWFLEHATWNGILLADFVFPWFLWVMGVCIPISIRSQLKRGVSRWKILGNILKRSLILFGLGMMLNTVGAGPDLETIRIPGVLQRFSITYMIVAVLGVCFTPRTMLTENRFPGSSFKEMFQDIIIIFPQWIVILSIAAAYCYFVFFSPIPGCPSGYLGPGGIQDSKRFIDCTGGMTGYVDRVLLGVKHIYQHSTASEVYKAGPFDPEGILGILPSILQAFLGVQAGVIFLHYPEWKGKLIRWFIWGASCAIIALVLALPGIVPINKNLWSLSFVFTTTSVAFFLLSLIYFMQDHLRIWNGVPFKAPGMNPTILYVGHIITNNLFPFHWRYGNMNTHFILTIETLWSTSLWIIIAYWLYYIEFFLSI